MAMARVERGAASARPLGGAVAGPPAQGARQVKDLETAAFITQMVALSTGVGAAEIADPGRNSALAARARQVAMYVAHTSLSWPLWRVGQAFGRDRTTAGHACTVVERLRDDAAFDAALAEIEACLGAAPAVGALSLRT